MIINNFEVKEKHIWRIVFKLEIELDNVFSLDNYSIDQIKKDEIMKKHVTELVVKLLKEVKPEDKK